MTLSQQMKVIDNLSKIEKKWFDLICICQGNRTPPKIAAKLIDKGLACKVPGGYDVASYWVHMAWCRHCSESLPESEIV